MTSLFKAHLETGIMAHPRPYLESLRDMIAHDELVHGTQEAWSLASWQIPRPYLKSLQDKVVHDTLFMAALNTGIMTYRRRYLESLRDKVFMTSLYMAVLDIGTVAQHTLGLT